MILCLGTTPAVQRVMSFRTLEIDGVNRALRTCESAAGKAVNVAKVVRQLGGEALAVGFAGGDRGRFLLGELDRLGVKHEFVAADAPTRQCITVIDETNHTQTELVEESAPVEARAWERLLRRLEELVPAARVVVMSGTLAPGGPADLYARVTEIANRAGVMTVVDAVGEPLLAALARRPTVVKPNRLELARTVNRELQSPQDVAAAVGELADRGASWVAVTAGARGAFVGNATALWQVTTPAIQVINPIGSGDSFAAGLAVAMAEGREIPDAVRLANACGASNASTLLAGTIGENVYELERESVVKRL